MPGGSESRAQVVGGDFYDDLGETGAGKATRWAGSDHNLFWSPNGAPIRFTDDGLSLAEWQAQNWTAGRALPLAILTPGNRSWGQSNIHYRDPLQKLFLGPG